MKKSLLCIFIAIGILSFSLISQSSVDDSNVLTPRFFISAPLENVDDLTTASLPGRFELSFTIALDEEEKTFRNNIITIMINDAPFMYVFNSYVSLSNNGVIEKAVLNLPRHMIVKMADSDNVVIKIGGNRDTQLNSAYQSLLVSLLEETKEGN